MSVKKGNFSRREFIKTAGGVGLGSALISLSSLTHAHGSSSTRLPENMVVPMRTFGKTGVNVSILSLGGVLGIHDQLIFRQAFKMGITYWDTADSYGGGKKREGHRKILCQIPK